MRAYKLLDEKKYYDEENIKDFNMDRLKNAIGIQISSLGAMGRGGLIFVITQNGEEILFDYFSFRKEGNTVYLENSSVFDIVKEHLPIWDEDLMEKWEILNRQAGWSFYVRKDYLKKFYKACKKLIKTDKHYKQMRNRRVSASAIINEFIIPHNGMDILFELVKGE